VTIYTTSFDAWAVWVSNYLTPNGDNMYFGVIAKLEERIKACIAKDASLKTLTDPWAWLRVPGFEYKDLSPTLSQVIAALQQAGVKDCL
jgi:hypothetical protein